MTYLTPFAAAAVLIGGLAAWQPDGDAPSRAQDPCAGTEEAIARADRSRNGIAVGCVLPAFEREAAR